MKPTRLGPQKYEPMKGRPRLTWPDGARVALWINPNIEFFGLDDVLPGNVNERVTREHAKIPNVRSWSVRDYGNRVGIWRLMEVLSRYGIRATAALNSEVCDHHPQIIEEGVRLGWEFIGHNQTNAMRLNEMPPEQELDAIHATLERIARHQGQGQMVGSVLGLQKLGTHWSSLRKRASGTSATGLTMTSHIISRLAIRSSYRYRTPCKRTMFLPTST
jgi:allantoinase